ncbi:MAG: hypothetical protein KGK01_07150 [Bradyrhizobium sp.]|uniref:hypothetical protein n=1 Tax=Bradyrhizobium sp. TaxID=376 RepID=UPI001C2A0F0D|nr:hypothetical protein [Bradyrhizobium sp.]MBU6464152.1 hypothetical protein [Pseudomonadota bacterium]MDE2068486.1 hypothetical protein [Bradyrhizobium sp.]MDE2242215.1 hypothetical protein [Bradyrhizobium sp.]MDE2471215.1 hypothetical protein [Bradyrhizobium sp.]
MSEQADQTSGESGSTGAGPIVPNSSISKASDSGSCDSSSSDSSASGSRSADELAAAPTLASAEAPSLVPDQNVAGETPKVETAKVEAAKVQVAKLEAPKAEAPKAEAPKVDAFKATAKPDAARPPGKLLIVSAADQGWDRPGSGPETQSEPGKGGKRRLAAAAVVALAALAGALGGAMATAGLQHFAGNAAVLSSNPGSAKPDLEASIARIDSDLVALKASVEHTSKVGVSQFNKTSDRLDKLEKAQAEPAAKLAKLSEAVEKLHAGLPVAPAATAASQAAKDVTGSVTPPATSPAAAAAPRPEVGRLPIVDNWILTDVSRGGAWIESRRGIYEVYAGDMVPGLGHIDAVRRQDGRWVVVTSRGLIVAR